MAVWEPKVPSAEEFQAWKLDPVTQEIYHLLRLWKKSLQEQWSRGVFQKETPQATAEANAAALGQIEILNKLIDLEPIDIEGALSDEQ